MEKKTQLDFVLQRLEENGRVSRNDCLRHFFTRLSARILDLRSKGYEFEVKREEGDYIYVLTYNPHKVLRQLTLV